MERKVIKVLHVAEAAGGVDRYLKLLFKYMDENDIENYFVCSQNYDINSYKNIVSNIDQIEMSHQISPINDSKVIKTIRKFIKNYKPDVIYGHSSKAGAYARIASIGLNVKVIYNPHGWAFNMRVSDRKRNMYRIIEKIQIPYTDKVVCISEAEKISALKNNICNENKLEVINNGVDIDSIKNTVAINRKILNIPENAFVVGTVGRICEQKAPDIFIKAAKLIKNKIPESFFVIVGDETVGENFEKSKILKLIEEENLTDSVLITGWVDNPVSYMKLFDVGMLLSRWEGFGLVLPEYMAANVPVVATSTDAIPYIIKNDINGLLVEVDDPVAVTNAVYKIWNNKSLRVSLVENGKSIVQLNYDAKRVSKETQKLIKKLVKQ